MDDAHSAIEKVLKDDEFFWPIGLIRLLKTVNRKHPYIILKMLNKELKDYVPSLIMFDYKKVALTKANMLKYTQALKVLRL
jgi:hypothetical protein